MYKLASSKSRRTVAMLAKAPGLVNLAGLPESIQMVCLNFEQGGF
jgi:hypothetical protein